MLNYDCKYNTEKPLCQGFWGKKILHAIVKWLNMTQSKGEKGPQRPRDHRDQEKSRTAVDSIFSLVPWSLRSHGPFGRPSHPFGPFGYFGPYHSLSLPITPYHTTPTPCDFVIL